MLELCSIDDPVEILPLPYREAIGLYESLKYAFPDKEGWMFYYMPTENSRQGSSYTGESAQLLKRLGFIWKPPHWSGWFRYVHSDGRIVALLHEPRKHRLVMAHFIDLPSCAL